MELRLEKAFMVLSWWIHVPKRTFKGGQNNADKRAAFVIFA